MTTNPYLNALAAAAYVTLVASMMFFGSRFIGPVDTLLMPIGMLSLLVFSVLVMAVCFLYQPVQLFLEGDKKAATALFIKTVATFALITFCIFVALLILSPASQNVPSIETTPSDLRT